MTAVILPKFPRPVRMGVDYLDFGISQRGASSLRVDRPGNRHRLTFVWAVETMDPEIAAKFISRLKRGKRRDVQIDILLPQAQGSPGSPVVNGAGQSGTALAVRGLTPNYTIKDDYWFTVIESDTKAYLHSAAEPVRANASGQATIQIEPPLRAPFADGAVIQMARPFIRGELVGETFSYAYESMRRVPLTITIEERQ